MRAPFRATLIAVAGICTSAAVHAQTFRPFTPVDNVCPTCKTGPQFDRILLQNGTEVRARVLAQNDAFYVLEKYGELRAVGRDQVKSVDLAGGDRPAGFPDQILFKDGIVIAGTLRDNLNTDWFDIIYPPNELHKAYKPAIASVYRGGKLVFSGDGK